MASTKRRIEVKSAGEVIHIEAIAGESGIYPGMLLKINSSGELIKNSTAGGGYGDEIIIALEEQLQGEKNVATVYTSGQRVFAIIPRDGDEVNLLMVDGADIDVGDKIISNGNGLLKETTGVPKSMIGVAVEDNDLSATANIVNALSTVRIAR